MCHIRDQSCNEPIAKQKCIISISPQQFCFIKVHMTSINLQMTRIYMEGGHLIEKSSIPLINLRGSIRLFKSIEGRV